MFLPCLILTVAGFFSGSVMYSYYIPKRFFGVDARLAGGDRNPGSTNAVRALGAGVGGLCMALDVLKALVPVSAAVLIFHLRGAALVPVMLAPMCGHLFPPSLRFRGGKGVAATFGSLLGVVTVSRSVFVLAFVLAALTFVVVVQPPSARVMTGAAVAAVIVLAFEPLAGVKVAFCLLMALLFWRHMTRPDPGPYTIGTRQVRFEVEYSHHRLHVSRV